MDYVAQTKIFRDSLMVRMSACRVLDRGSIPRRGVLVFSVLYIILNILILRQVKPSTVRIQATGTSTLSHMQSRWCAVV